MRNIHFNLTLKSFVLITMLTFYNGITQNKNEGLSAQKKHFKNLNASLVYPENFQEIETDFSYTFIDSNNDFIYIASIYVDQNFNQVKQAITDNLSQNGFAVTLTKDFTQKANGLSTADATVQYAGNEFPGHLIMKKSGNNTYLFFGCVTNEQLFSQQKKNLEQMALSLQTKIPTQQNKKTTAAADNISNPKSVSDYQNLLMDKVLVNSKRSRDMISTDDHTQSRGKWITSEDVSKTRRFTLCGAGLGYFRFVSTGHQMTGDYGTYVLDKHSGFWNISSNAGKIGIYMEDERNGRNRFFEINGIKNNMIFIENRPYEIFTQEQSGNECLQPDGKLVIPD